MANALYSTRTIPVEHVTISSSKPFEDVRAKLATLAPRIDDGIFTLLRYGESARAFESWRHVRRSPFSVSVTTGRC
jgi:hypothetical protein